MLTRYRFEHPSERDQAAVLLNEDYVNSRGRGGHTHCGVHICDKDCKDLLAFTADPPYIPLDTGSHRVKVTVSTVRLDINSLNLAASNTGASVGGSWQQTTVPEQKEPLYRCGDLGDLPRGFFGFPEVYFTAVWKEQLLFSKRALHYLHVSTELVELIYAAKEAVRVEEQKEPFKQSSSPSSLVGVLPLAGPAMLESKEAVNDTAQPTTGSSKRHSVNLLYSIATGRYYLCLFQLAQDCRYKAAELRAVEPVSDMMMDPEELLKDAFNDWHLNFPSTPSWESEEFLLSFRHYLQRQRVEVHEQLEEFPGAVEQYQAGRQQWPALESKHDSNNKQPGQEVKSDQGNEEASAALSEVEVKAGGEHTVVAPTFHAVVNKDDIWRLADDMNSALSRFGLEVAPFKVGWYNKVVAPEFALPQAPDAIAFCFLSNKRMFAQVKEYYIVQHLQDNKTDNDLLEHLQDSETDHDFPDNKTDHDPVDAYTSYILNAVAHGLVRYQSSGLLRDGRPQVYTDFGQYGAPKRPFLLQPAGHISGMVRYVRPAEVTEEHLALIPKPIYGSAIHPIYGGWYAFRGAIVYADIGCTDAAFAQRDLQFPALDSEMSKMTLLHLYNKYPDQDLWRDLFSKPDTRYDLEQAEYFRSQPGGERRVFIKLCWLREFTTTHH